MIVPMKKVFLIVQNRDVEPALKRLRELGVLHVAHLRLPKSSGINQLKDDIKLLEQAVNYLTHEHKNPQQVEAPDWKETADVVLGLAALMDRDREGIAKRQVQIEQWEPWGDFSLEDIEQLRAKGLKVELVEVPEKDVSSAPEGVILAPVFVKHKIARCMALSYKDGDIPYKILPLPHQRLRRIKEEQGRLRKRIKKAHQQMFDNSRYLDHLKKVLARLKDDLDFKTVLEGRGGDKQLSVIQGFCPQDLTPQLESSARTEQWGVLFEDPKEEDQVPTLLRNPKWVETVNPLFDLTNIIPGYRELDVSPFFLVFFSLFVGILIGDAGYGTLILLAAVFFRHKLRKKNQETDKVKLAFRLGFLLCGCVIAWGVLTGTYFGQAWLTGKIKPLIPWLTNEKNVQLVCFIIGGVHLSIAHGWRAVLKMPRLHFLSDVGWILFIWGMFFWVKFFVLGSSLPSFANWLAGAGMVLVLFMTCPNRNPLISLRDLGVNIVFDFISTFTDIISYIRLFAVGLATVAVADAANSMGPVWIIILYTVNIILAVLALVVHGIRLNTLEFSTHLGLQWAGFEYSPFKKKNFLKKSV